MSTPATDSRASASVALEDLARRTVACVKKARKHRLNLNGDNFYANKLATLRADATNTYRTLVAGSAGEASAIAELIEAFFSATTSTAARRDAYRELSFNLRTAWQSGSKVPADEDSLFPLSLLAQANRGYLVTVGRQMNGCYSNGWYDAASVMTRRLVEVAIIEGFEGKDIAAKIKAKDGTFLQLTELIGQALAEPTWTLTRNARRVLPSLRDLGHMSAHGIFHRKKRRLRSRSIWMPCRG